MTSTHTTHSGAWWSIAWRNLWRDARAGELRLLLVAVALGVAALSSVSFLADRMNAGLQRDAGQLLGGDAVVVSDNPTPAHIVTYARALGLQGVTTLSFPTMARAEQAQGGESRLVALKAVESGYPLRGQLKLSANMDQAQTALAQGAGAGKAAGQSGVSIATGVPAPGEVWAELGVLEALGLNTQDRLMLGNSSLRITQVLLQEPDRGAGFMSFAPRVLMNSADLAATALVQPASRITWRFAVVGPAAAVQRFKDWAALESKKPQVRGLRGGPKCAKPWTGPASS